MRSRVHLEKKACIMLLRQHERAGGRDGDRGERMTPVAAANRETEQAHLGTTRCVLRNGGVWSLERAQAALAQQPKPKQRRGRGVGAAATGRGRGGSASGSNAQ